MSLEQYANAFSTALASPMLVGDDHAHVTGAAPVALQGGQSRFAIDSELLLLTAGASTTTWTVTRGVEGTTAVAHAAGAVVTHVLTAASLLGAPGVFDPRAFGAKFDGVTDDTAAIEAASLAAAAVKGTILCPPGTAIVSWFENPGHATYWAGVIVRTGCSLRGAGIGATTIKLAASQASHASANMIANYELDGGDEKITIADLTIDGNGANQTTLYSGIGIVRARGVRHERVRVVNVRGTGSSPPGETFGMVATYSTDLDYTDCEVIGTAGTHGSGFGSNVCTNVLRTNCIAHGMSAGMGFADWTSKGVLNVNCIAQQNGSNGFNCEVSEDASYVNCRSGGHAAVGATNYPFTSDQVLGNTGSGFTFTGSTRVLLDGCLSSHNTNNGLDCVASGGTGSSVRVVNSILADNTGVGMYFDDTSLPLCYIAPSVATPGNAYDGYFGTTIGQVNATHNLAAPAVPATGVPYANPYPFEVVLYIVGSPYFILVDGANIGITSGTVTLKSGSTIQMNYGTAPTWTWWRQ